jgi:hypothetical protein
MEKEYATYMHTLSPEDIVQVSDLRTTQRKTGKKN